MSLKKSILIFVVLSLTGCAGQVADVQNPTSSPSQEVSMESDMNAGLDASNPFSKPSALPYGAPEYDKIKTEHFRPALEAGIAQHLSEIEAIANQSEEPTFDNTIVALERTGDLIARALPVFDNLSNAYTSDEIQAIETELSPKFAAYSDAIYLNEKLYGRIADLYNRRDTLGLDAESLRLLEIIHRDFVRAGARLNPEQKAEIQAINSELSGLETKISQNILSEMKSSAVVVDSREELAGLSEEEIADAAALAESKGLNGKYMLGLQNTSIQPVLSKLSNRELRKKIHEASIVRGMRGNEADNRSNIARVLQLKARKAEILGYDSPAAYQLEVQMAKNVDAVNAMLSSMVPAARESLAREAAQLQEMIDAEGGGFTLEAYDWMYYAEKLRKSKYQFDEAEIKPYFELNNVITKGVFYAAEKLYGLKFVERHDFPVYDPDVRVWEVFNEDGTAVGLFYGDYYARENKRGGAWMSEYVNQSHLKNTKPVILNQINISKPGSGPTLLTLDEVTTLFHEFGHALHGLLSDVTYPEFSGTNVARDFVEFPSQFNEVWALWPEVLDNYAVHYESGEKIPAELVEKIRAAGKFNQGYMTVEYLGAAMLDQAWFQYNAQTLPEITPDNFEFLEKSNLARVNLDIPTTPPRYRTAYFNHLFASHYDAMYYSYIWSEVLDADAEHWFKEHGLTRENGQHLRDSVLSRGNTADSMTLYRNFTGGEPSSEYLLIRRGLK
ncbi:MAG: M3 family metallopeptidase [Bradymonadia bacterium]